MKKYRIAINFDLDTKKLKSIYVSPNRKKYNYAYSEIKSFMKARGFSHRQWSGYLSKEPMTETQAAAIIKKMGSTYPWLKQCARRIDLTVVRRHFDLTGLLNQSENDNPVKDNFDKQTFENIKEKSNTDFEAKYEDLSQKYNDLVKSYSDLLEASIQKENLINTTNLVFNEHPELKEEFKKAKAETLQRKAEQEKRKGGPNDKSVKNELSEHKPKKHNKKL